MNLISLLFKNAGADPALARIVLSSTFSGIAFIFNDIIDGIENIGTITKEVGEYTFYGCMIITIVQLWKYSKENVNARIKAEKDYNKIAREELQSSARSEATMIRVIEKNTESLDNLANEIKILSNQLKR